MAVKLIPDTPQTRRKMQELARHQMILKLHADILMDMQICDIEGWDKMEYINQLRSLLNTLGGENGRKNQRNHNFN